MITATSTAVHTSFVIIKNISLCYGLGVDMVHPDFPFETPFERSQEFIRSTARPMRQRYSIPRGVGVLARALGGGDRE